MRRIYLLLATALPVYACSHQSNSQQAPPPAESGISVSSTVQVTSGGAKAIPGKPIAVGITDTVYSSSDASIKYAVYLPPSYSAAKKYPVVYFFDPHGHGDLPLKFYKNLADRYGYILAGSYNSKNGMQWSATEKVAQAFMQDTWQRLSIDNSRIYTCGFSGGALAASSIALYDGGVAGVIACGSGFPVKNPQINTPFAFIGLVGIYDFHLTDMKMLNKALKDSPLPHQLIVFAGTHQWAPNKIVEEAFQWLDVNAMKMHFIPKKDSVVKAVYDEFMNEAKNFEKKKNLPEELLTFEKIENYLTGLMDLSIVSSKIAELEKLDAVQKYLLNDEAAERQEMNDQQQLINALSDKDLDWWNQTVSGMMKTIKTDSGSAEAKEDKRLLNYMSLATYMGASQAFKAYNDDAASHFLELYKMVDPTNPEHSYLYACMFARANNSEKAITYLHEAVNLGFSDYRRMKTDSNFTSLKNLPAYQQLLKKVSDMPPKIDMTQ